MKLSIFPKAQALPSKEDKGKQARFTSKPYLPEILEFVTHEDLIEVICNHAWSPFIFEEYRSQDGFCSADVLAFDIDNGQTIEEAEAMVHKLDIAALCIPSTSHTDDAHRFRLIFPLAKTITKADAYKATYSKVAEYFSVDPACKDVARFFFGGKLVDGFWYEGKLLEPVKPVRVVKAAVERYNSREAVVVGDSIEELVVALFGESRTKIPDCVAHFLENAPDNLDGQWYNSSNSFLFTCGLMGLDKDRITDVFFSLYPHEELTERKVSAMIEDGMNAREDEV
tara:strand:+ start:3757 stop:4605 length:849 start_codon:yes stop_codon:yes gene_type:complete